MDINKIFTLGLLISLSISAHADETARIRLFGQNQVSTKLYTGQACHNSFFSGKGIKVSGGMVSAFGSLLGLSSSKSIGIPETDSTHNLKEKSGVLSKAYYKEYEIPAQQPSTVSMALLQMSTFTNVNGKVKATINSTTGSSCSDNVSFIAKPNTDYEVNFTNECRLTISEVVKKGEGQLAELVPINVQEAPKCS
jgi:hypothetical protein